MHQLIHIISAFLVILAASACGVCFGQGIDTREPTRAPSHNPFRNVRFFLNPEYIAKIETTAQKHPHEASTIRKVAKYPTAVWLDSIKSVEKLPHWLDEAKKEQTATGQPTLTVIVVYNLPNRDCAAQASLGELKASENGEARYETEFISPITAQFKAHSDQPIVVVLEPDSLGNLATNMNIPKCQEAQSAYINSIAYAIKKFDLQNVSIYLDAAHSGWLGWDDNRTKIAKIFQEVLNKAGGPQKIKGFAINIANYTPLNNRDGAKLEPSNPCPNELAYARKLSQTLSMYAFKNHNFIVDTSRNGKGGIRANWGSWCNVHGAGLGERPRADPEPGIDAYFWIKPPGESDGVSDPTQPRFDEMCASPDAAGGAPQASEWFESYFLDLVHNARPPI
jgi:cellulose 1,4-beta-cellobiosidase